MKGWGCHGNPAVKAGRVSEEEEEEERAEQRRAMPPGGRTENNINSTDIDRSQEHVYVVGYMLIYYINVLFTCLK